MESIERTVVLPTDPSDTWALITRPENLIGWLGTEVDLDPSPGSVGHVVDRDGTHRSLLVTEVVDGERIAWVWRDERGGEPSDVSVTLREVEDGTEVRVVETVLQSAASAQAHTRASAAWSDRLLNLESLLLVAAAVRG